MVPFEEGKKVRIKTFKKRPSHWCKGGNMDGYMGRVVTMERLFLINCVSIKEGDMKWCWRESDFEPLNDFKLLKDNMFVI